MRCRECGARVEEGSKFCMECGAKVIRKKRRQRLVSLICEDCGGSMDIDENRNLMFCPFCGSKKIYFDDPEVVIEKTITDRQKARYNRDIEIEKERTRVENEKTRFEMQKEKWEYLFGIIVLIVIVLYLFISTHF